MRALTVFVIIGMLFVSAVFPDGKREIAPSSEDEFTFVRLKYRGRRSIWDIDWPASDRNFIFQLRKHTNINVSSEEKIVDISSKELFHYPFAYMLEVSRLILTESESENLREYLLRGGFILVDDFHGGRQWKQFYKQFKKIFPKREPVDIPISHPLFHCFYHIDELMQIPGAGAALRGKTYEKRDGRPARCLGVYDDNGRLMMMINFNTDLGDGWEHAAEGFYPRDRSDMAFKLGINAVVYALTH